MKTSTEKWEKLTNKLTEQFIRDYFEIEEDEDIQIDWVANDIGGVFEFADMYFNFDTVLKCYELGVSKEQLFQWYDWCIENQFVNISLARFILSPKERKEQEEKHLAELRYRVEMAQKELEQAIEHFKTEK